MSSRKVNEFLNEYGGELVEIITADAHGGLPAFWQVNVETDGSKRVLVLSEHDSAVLSGSLLPEHWWEALLRQAYRMGWAAGAEESNSVDRHGADATHPNEDAVVARLLALQAQP